jgi:hypothetical protein
MLSTAKATPPGFVLIIKNVDCKDQEKERENILKNNPGHLC